MTQEQFFAGLLWIGTVFAALFCVGHTIQVVRHYKTTNPTEQLRTPIYLASVFCVVITIWKLAAFMEVIHDDGWEWFRYYTSDLFAPAVFTYVVVQRLMKGKSLPEGKLVAREARLITVVPWAVLVMLVAYEALCWYVTRQLGPLFFFGSWDTVDVVLYTIGALFCSMSGQWWLANKRQRNGTERS